MAEVVEFKKPSPLIWVCECGCTTFQIFSDGNVTCAGCGAPHADEGSGWLDLPPENQHSGLDPDKTYRDVMGNGSVDFARQRLIRMAQSLENALIMVARYDGSISLWSDAETPE